MLKELPALLEFWRHMSTKIRIFIRWPLYKVEVQKYQLYVINLFSAWRYCSKQIGHFLVRHLAYRMLQDDVEALRSFWASCCSEQVSSTVTYLTYMWEELGICPGVLAESRQWLPSTVLAHTVYCVDMVCETLSHVFTVWLWPCLAFFARLPSCFIGRTDNLAVESYLWVQDEGRCLVCCFILLALLQCTVGIWHLFWTLVLINLHVSFDKTSLCIYWPVHITE
jgi:hypothetical protein